MAAVLAYQLQARVLPKTELAPGGKLYPGDYIQV